MVRRRGWKERKGGMEGRVVKEGLDFEEGQLRSWGWRLFQYKLIQHDRNLN